MNHPAHLMRMATGCAPHGWQARLFGSTSGRLRIDAHRRAGKSTAAVVLAVAAASRDGATVLLASATARQSGELFDKALSLLARLPAGFLAAIVGRTLTLAGGGRIVALPADVDRVRGYAPDLIVVDDAGRVPADVRDAIVASLIVSGGRLIEMTAADEHVSP